MRRRPASCFSVLAAMILGGSSSASRRWRPSLSASLASAGPTNKFRGRQPRTLDQVRASAPSARNQLPPPTKREVACSATREGSAIDRLGPRAGLLANTREQLATHAEESFVTDPGPIVEADACVFPADGGAGGGSGRGAVEPQEAWLRDFHAGTRDCMERATAITWRRSPASSPGCWRGPIGRRWCTRSFFAC